jgi:nucleotidyltransferase substrate binding protein (TIGR01987 family)
MKKYDNFINCLEVLKKADFNKVSDDEIYRTGIIAQFNLTFELAWKALQETLKLHSVIEAETGSPREILKIGFSKGFVNDQEIWLLMLRKRNTSIHVYDENEADELTILIKDSFIKAFDDLAQILKNKINEI